VKRPPTAYILVFGGFLVVALFSALVHWGVPPFDNLQVFIFSQVASLFTLVLLGVMGGAAVGMLVAHRILSNRDFSPFERSVLESLSDIRERLDRLEGERGAAQVHEKARR
jgi:hypothetical protein